MKCRFENYVGVIDSGVGGLTILRQLQNEYPFCNYIYLADSAYCPYGTKGPQEISRRVETIISFLQDNSVQAVVLACNTASVFADTLRNQFDIPIYDVIAPTCQLVSKVTQTKRVALLATSATVKSCAYQQRLNDSGIAVVSFPCSSFVPFVEANAVDTPECDVALHCALHELPHCNVDTVILGCTHFPILRKKIAPYVNGANIVECVADFSSRVSASQQAGNTIFLTTGSEKSSNFAAKWFGNIQFLHIDL